MKKFLTALCTVLLIAVFAVTMAGCGKSADVKTAYKNAGYEITTVPAKDNEDLKKLLNNLKEEDKIDIEKFEVLECTYLSRKATIVIFPSEESVEIVLGESTYASKLEGGYINGECYLISYSGADALNVFKSVKKA